MKRKFDKKKSRNQNSDNLLNKKRVCQFSAANVEEIDYKDVDLLSKFINESGKNLSCKDDRNKRKIPKTTYNRHKKSETFSFTSLHRQS